MIGERLGPWLIGSGLGEGTQGTVYAARHVDLDREAAIKVLRPNLARDRVRVERFFDEARAAGRIRHPGVVEIFDCGRETNYAYIAMERLVGETLHARLRSTPVTLAEALTIVRQIAESLAAAHALGVVHRDLKPENVFLAERGAEIVVKLLDFGIAKLAPDQRASGTLTGAGLLGTPPYMSPEQCRGAAVDHRADLYALGCLLHELLTGIPPFGFDHAAELVVAHRESPPPALVDGFPDAPAELDDLAARLLAKDPEARPSSAAEVVAVIDRLALAGPIARTRAAVDAPSTPTVVEPSRGRARMWRALLDAPSWLVAAVCSGLGATMLGVAIIDGVGDSYGASNWGFTFIVLVPLIVSFLLKTITRADAAVRELASRRMLTARSGIDVHAVAGAASVRLGVGLVGFGVPMTAISIAVSIGEWHHRWSTAPIAGTWWSGSVLMGVVGAICQGGLITMILVFAVYCIGWGNLISQFATPRSPVRLAVDPLSADPRRGFDALEQPMVLALITGALVQVALYLSNVQHFAEVRGESLFATLVPGDLGGLLDVGTGRYPSTTTLLASLLVSSFLLAGGFLVLRAIRETAAGVWPLTIGPAWLAVVLVVISLATVFYRLAPLVAVVLVPTLVRLRRPAAS